MCPVPAGRVCDKPTTQTADYHGLDPWTAETSGKWLDGRKSPYQATAKTNMENGNKSPRWHQRSRCQSSEALPVLGVPQLPVGAMRSKGVSACTVTF